MVTVSAAAPAADIRVGHVLDELALMDADSVSCCVTSPPYWSLRKYDAPADALVWGGDGSEGCGHEWGEVAGALSRTDGGYSSQRKWQHGATRENEPEAWGGVMEGTAFCSRCGAWHGGSTPTGGTLKPKDLVLMPSRVALAAQQDGWWVRSMIVWHKPNAMPESAQDRPTSAHETILMLTRSARYWYDADAVREAYNPNSLARYGYEFGNGAAAAATNNPSVGDGTPHRASPNPSGRNLRDVWTFSTAQTPEAHFATFPEELPKRCILASCPREVCANPGCGHARVRLTDGASYYHERDETKAPQKYAQVGNGHGDVGRGPKSNFGASIATTTGWTDCDCEHPDYQPGLVLDPFAGIGTTGAVALRLGRRAVLIELSEKYAAMARDKLALWWRPTTMVEPERDKAQMTLALDGATESEAT